jgi:hypothetical protein
VLERVGKARSPIGATGRRGAHQCSFSTAVWLGREELIAGGVDSGLGARWFWPASDVESVACLQHR